MPWPDGRARVPTTPRSAVLSARWISIARERSGFLPCRRNAFMLSLAPVAPAVAAPTQLELHRLGGSVFLLCWTLEASPFGKPSIALTGGGRRLAAASISLGLRDGRERLAVAFRVAGQDSIVATLSDHGPQGEVTAAFDPALVHGLAEPNEILKDLAPQAGLPWRMRCCAPGRLCSASPRFRTTFPSCASSCCSCFRSRWRCGPVPCSSKGNGCARPSCRPISRVCRPPAVSMAPG